VGKGNKKVTEKMDCVGDKIEAGTRRRIATSEIGCSRRQKTWGSTKRVSLIEQMVFQRLEESPKSSLSFATTECL